ncbi:MAG: alanine--tRNA ligase [Candidatus Aminicenantes bacterium]|nr:alanine--tRNA ligase [Candidatus Aminicenantes bacterium]NIM79415.1 alanine--tRNA ligase [Candidatus Aminicenantes bacterium]NIN18697.1 alanine--tRNA ligase [Candidatus Aminicenantes bacterium]NIN42621.1 alanine--tRNA ligase [Candidatus Aminicenantes bacterium]NIN85360.1 alanine--tRNA ligase [Candidatus Aminicenantes bacterium]
MKNAEIRETFYSYFIKHTHHKVLSAPLVPAKDPTLLFTNAGMNQFKGVFLREETREYNRAVSIQKCMRISGKHNDFDEVGKSDFHHTFFEMLGNFSFGDYFKEKAIEFGWELLTEYYHFKPERLWVTVFQEDDEAFRIWEEKIGVPAHKIMRMGEKDNFWQMGETGPCGPCSEIHYDRGEAFGPETFSDENKRYIEVWNLVFMQYDKDEKGKLNPLPAPSIDTGMGMERLTALLQGVNSNYQTDLFRPLIEYTAELASATIDPDTTDPTHRVALNVVADHIRALCFLISDGILPANDGRGYVLRRILRRAAKHGKALDFTSAFLHQVSSKVVEVMKDFYPELEYNRDFISEVILAEEERFNNTLLNGLKRFEELLARALEQEEKIIPGSELFKLSDTYGFPLDFARDLAMEKDVGIDYQGFQAELKQQRERSRISLAAKQKATKALENIETYATAFTGYSSLEKDAVLLAIYIDGKEVPEIRENQEGVLVFDKTPFYAESGGQVGDTGVGKNDTAFFNIVDTRKAAAGGSGASLHSVQVKKGTLRPGDEVSLTVDAGKRKNTAVHHSSTHLLHAALREVLGLHVKQAGSYVGPDKLRFDFTHFKPLTREELREVEFIVNRKVRENISIKTEDVKYEEAIDRGAIAIFEEKYSDVVRMLSMGDFSKELCGGTHLEATGEIGFFKITGESSISAGVRRIEAVAGDAGYAYVRENLERFNDIMSHFKQKQDHIVSYLVHLDRQLKEKEKQLKKKQKLEKSDRIDISKIISEGSEINRVHTVAAFVDNMDRKQLSALADEVKHKTGGIAVLFSNLNGKSAIVVSIAKSLIPGLDAGEIVKEIAARVKGSGGGRPDFAQAGGEPVKNFLKFKPQVVDIITKHVQ